MSEWAEFCEDMGVNPGCPDDYDRLIDHISGKPLPGRRSRGSDDDDYLPADRLELERQAIRFDTREQAEEWSMRNNGRKFVQSIHGPHYVPENDVDAPITTGWGSGGHSVTLWPPKPYPKTNPRAATWQPGTYPTTTDEDELNNIDRENDQRRFFPRLRKLSPLIYRASQQCDPSSLPKSICQVYGQKMTQPEMYQLLSLAEDRIERHDKYMRTEAQAYRRPAKEREEPDHPGYATFDNVALYAGAPPSKDLAFWQIVYDAVMDELIGLI